METTFALFLCGERGGIGMELNLHTLLQTNSVQNYKKKLRKICALTRESRAGIASQLHLKAFSAFCSLIFIELLI